MDSLRLDQTWKVLVDILQTMPSVKFHTAELDYLRNSFFQVESMWESALRDYSNISAILIGEAPLFGTDQKYIYNINTPQSSFLYASQLPGYNQDKHGNGKIGLLSIMKDLGVVVMDLYPFALNSSDTPTLSMNQFSSSKFDVVAEQIFETYTRPKIEKLTDCYPNVKVLCRYSRLSERTQKLLGDRQAIPVWSSSMGIDKEKLARALQCT